MRAWGCPQTRALSSGARFPTQHASGLATSSQTHFSWALASGDGLITTSYFSQNESESHSVVSVSLRPHGQYSPWSSPGQNTGVGSLSLLPTGWSNPGDLPCPGIEPRSPALQAEPAKPQEKPKEVLEEILPSPKEVLSDSFLSISFKEERLAFSNATCPSGLLCYTFLKLRHGFRWLLWCLSGFLGSRVVSICNTWRR